MPKLHFLLQLTADGRSSVNALSLVEAGIRPDNATTLRLNMAVLNAVASRLGPAIHKPVLVHFLRLSHFES